MGEGRAAVTEPAEELARAWKIAERKYGEEATLAAAEELHRLQGRIEPEALVWRAKRRERDIRRREQRQQGREVPITDRYAATDAHQTDDRHLRPHRVTRLIAEAEDLADDDPELQPILEQIGQYAAQEAAETLDRADADIHELLAAMSSDQRVRWVVAWIAHEETVTDDGHTHTRRVRDKWLKLRAQTDRARASHKRLTGIAKELGRRKRFTSALHQELADLASRDRAIPHEARGGIHEALIAATEKADGHQRGGDATARGHAAAVHDIEAAVKAARVALENLADALWPELNLGKARPGDAVDARLRGRLRGWGLSYDEIDRARAASGHLRRLLRDRRGSAARNAVSRGKR